MREWYLTIIREDVSNPVDFQRLGEITHNGTIWDVGFFAYDHDHPVQLIEEQLVGDGWEVLARCEYGLEREGYVDPVEILSDDFDYVKPQLGQAEYINKVEMGKI